jgi:steroid delta-isomerase-like uncharacterized protein
MSEQNKALTRRYLEEVWNGGNLALADELIAADYVYHTPVPPEVHGPEGVKQLVSMYRAAYPDLHFTAEDVIAEGDQVVTRWTSRSTHQGELMGIPATGKRVTTSGINIVRFETAKIAEEWTNWDALGMLQQLGVIPPMGEGGA